MKSLTALTTLAGALAIAAAASCASSTGPSADGSDTTPAGTATTAPPPATPTAPPAVDPFAPQPDESEGLTNVSADLDALLEHGALQGACDRYKAGQTDRKTKLLCGKWMYFYETFGTAGMPSAIVKFLAQNFPDELGLGFEKLGLVPDPTSQENLPLGIAPTAPMQGNVEAVAFTCGSCHFGKLPDGRYAVGAPNLDYDYGGHILMMTLAPTLGMGMANAADHHPDAVAKVKPVTDKLANDFALKAKFGVKLLPLASMKTNVMSQEVEREYASWPRGTMDFVIAPLPIDDGVEVVGKIIGLWGIPRDTEVASSGMKHAMLAWSAVAKSLHVFLNGFATLGGQQAPPDGTFDPLTDYIYSLRAPSNPKPPSPTDVQTGARLFTEKGCITCHDGPRGSGKRPYTFAEMGTDDALAQWGDPSLSGNACCNIDAEPGSLTHGVKSPRLLGTWALRRFLHNGSLTSIEQLFCLEPRPSGQKPMGTGGHMMTCDNLAEPEKRALIAYLMAH